LNGWRNLVAQLAPQDLADLVFAQTVDQFDLAHHHHVLDFMPVNVETGYPDQVLEPIDDVQVKQERRAPSPWRITASSKKSAMEPIATTSIWAGTPTE
jgi:hypothetical protein